MKIYQDSKLPFAVTFNLDAGSMSVSVVEQDGSIKGIWKEIKESPKEFVDVLVNNFDVITEGDSSEDKARKWSILAELYSHIGLYPLYGFEYEGIEICNPYTTEEGFYQVENPEAYYGQAYLDWLKRFEHDVVDFPWPMPKHFSDSSWHNDTCGSITSEYHVLQIFCDAVNPDNREIDGHSRFTIIQSDRYGEVDALINHFEYYTDALDFINQYQIKERTLKKTIPLWADAFGLTREDLLTQYEVAFYEAVEATEAMVEKSLKEAFDAVCDVHWMDGMIKHLSNGERTIEAGVNRVLDAAVKQFGPVITEHLEQAKQDVLDSNFSKLCLTEENLNATIAKYEAMGLEVESQNMGGFWVVRSAKNQVGSDGKDYGHRKALKSVSFHEPEFAFLN